MKQKWVCQLDAENYYIGQVLADESPLEEGVFLIPAGSIETSPPELLEGKQAKWDGSKWLLEDIPKPEPEPEPEPPTAEQIAEAKRLEKQYAYQSESDPLFFKWQAGESTKEEWEAKRAEIKARYPD